MTTSFSRWDRTGHFRCDVGAICGHTTYWHNLLTQCGSLVECRLSTDDWYIVLGIKSLSLSLSYGQADGVTALDCGPMNTRALLSEQNGWHSHHPRFAKLDLGDSVAHGLACLLVRDKVVLSYECQYLYYRIKQYVCEKKYRRKSVQRGSHIQFHSQKIV